MNDQRDHVCVIGSGLTGVAVALSLAKRGCKVTVISTHDVQVLPVQQPDAVIPASASSYGGVPYFAESSNDPKSLKFWRSIIPQALIPCDLTLYWTEVDQQVQGPNGNLVASTLASLKARVPDAVMNEEKHTLIVPYYRVDCSALTASTPLILHQAGIKFVKSSVRKLEQFQDGTWKVHLSSSEPVHFRDVVLSAGAWNPHIWPMLRSHPQFRVSWSGVLELPVLSRKEQLELLPAEAHPGNLVQPLISRRAPLERNQSSLTPTFAAASTSTSSVIASVISSSSAPSSSSTESPSLQHQQPHRYAVDVSLAPRRLSWLLGQISVLPDDPCAPPPDAAWMEAILRRHVAERWPKLAALPGCRFQVAPVSYSSTGVPLMGRVPQTASTSNMKSTSSSSSSSSSSSLSGPWVFGGFSAPFAMVPALVEQFVDKVMQDHQQSEAVKDSSVEMKSRL